VRKTVQLIIGLVISSVAFGLAFWGVNLAEIVQALWEANYFYVLPAVALSLLGLFMRAQSWRVILGGQLPYRRVFDVMAEGYLLNNVLPFRLGEFGRAYLISRGRDLTASEALSSVVVERVIDLLMVVVLLTAFLPLVAGLPWARNFAFISTVFGLTALVTLVLMARNRQKVLSLAHALFSRLRFRWLPAAWVEARLANFLDGLSVLRDGRRAFWAAFWSGGAWVAAGLGAWVFLLGFVPGATITMGFFVLTILGLGVAVPSAPGSMGVFEYVVLLALSVFNVEQTRALSFALVFHASQLGLTSILGGLALVREGETLGHVVRAAQSVWMGARSPAPPEPPGMAESFLADSHAAGEQPATARAIDDRPAVEQPAASKR
jgi:glycosyltransferase 2 family protein